MAGSVVEMLVSFVLLIWNPYKEDCTCARGSFWGLTFGATVLFWSFGPGVVLLVMHEDYCLEKRRMLIKRRRAERREAREGASVRED
jgi:hypothetical protein